MRPEDLEGLLQARLDALGQLHAPETPGLASCPGSAETGAGCSRVGCLGGEEHG